MKYTLLMGQWHGEDETVGILSRDGVQMFCPFVAETNHCGSWCPLFDLRERDRIPQVDAPDLVRLEVRLHCGAGTRVIEVETSEREE